MTPELATDLAAAAHRARFSELIDLVEAGATAKVGHLGPIAGEALRLRPALSLSFPTADVAGAALGDDGRWQIETTCFGLYGQASPLPAFHTEQLIDHTFDGEGRVRDFLDLFNHRLLSLLARALRKHRALGPTTGVALGAVAGISAVAGTSAGISHLDDFPHAALLAGLVSRRPASAAAIEAILSAALPGIPVRVEPNLPSWTDLPAEERARLGAPLGGGLGSRTRTCATAFAVSIGPINGESLGGLLPGGPDHARVTALIAAVNPGRLECRLRLHVAPEALPPARIDGSRRLGRDTRLAGHDTGHMIDLAA